MVTLVKHEWHQCDVEYAVTLDEDLLAEIYPDLSEEEIAAKLLLIDSGELDVDEVLDAANDNDVDLDWEQQREDMWTMRKGGYDVSYELGDENSWHHEPPPPEPTHKCPKCKWNGQSYDADLKFPEEGSDDETKRICPYCESEVVLTEHGQAEEDAANKREAEWIARRNNDK